MKFTLSPFTMDQGALTALHNALKPIKDAKARYARQLAISGTAERYAACDNRLTITQADVEEAVAA